MKFSSTHFFSARYYKGWVVVFTHDQLCRRETYSSNKHCRLGEPHTRFGIPAEENHVQSLLDKKPRFLGHASFSRHYTNWAIPVTRINIGIIYEIPTWYHLLFYFTSFVLNMFRTLIYPSSGACDSSIEFPHWSYFSWFDVCWSFGVVGLEWYPCFRLKPATRIPPIFYTILCKTFPILSRIERDMIKNMYWYSCQDIPILFRM